MMSFLLRAGGMCLHWMVVQSVGDMPLRPSELSLRTARFTGVTVSRPGSGVFAESRKELWVRTSKQQDEHVE